MTQLGEQIEWTALAFLWLNTAFIPSFLQEQHGKCRHGVINTFT